MARTNITVYVEKNDEVSASAGVRYGGRAYVSIVGGSDIAFDNAEAAHRWLAQAAEALRKAEVEETRDLALAEAAKAAKEATA